MKNQTSRRWIGLPILLFFGMIFLFMFSMSMNRDLRHDEHLYVASGALLADQGLLPYVDYPYVHVPTLTFVYGLLFLLSEYKLLIARTFSIFCALASFGLIFVLTKAWFSAWPSRTRLLVTGAALLMWMSNPLFIYTSGGAWNHDLPLLLTLLAFACHSYGLWHNTGRKWWGDDHLQNHLFNQLAPSPAVRSDDQGKWLFLSGFLIALAACTRLSFLILLAPFLFVMWLMPRSTPQGTQTRRDQIRIMKQALIFGGGVVIACLPTLLLFIMAPKQFLFGNVTYHQLNILYKTTTGHGEAMTVIGKMAYLGQLILGQVGNLLVVLLFVMLLIPIRRMIGTRGPFELTFVLCLLPFLLIGALAVTPSQQQYFYVLIPFLLLASLLALSIWPTSRQKVGLTFLVVASSLSVVAVLPQYAVAMFNLFPPRQWWPVQIHENGVHIEALVEQGKVLTLAPIYSLEGGGEIYEQFATGPFTWRVSNLVPPENSAPLNLVPKEQLASFLQEERPSAVLVGYHNADQIEEAPLIAYAKQNGYVPVHVEGEATLWLLPLAEWDNRIRLAGYLLPQEPLQAGDSLLTTFYLQSVAPIEEDLNVLVRLIARDGTEIWRDEGWPWGSPTSTWQKEEVWPDGHEVTLPADTAPGYYRFEMSFYDPQSFDSLPITDLRRGETIGDAFVVDYLVVGEMPKPPANASPVELGSAIRLLGRRLDLTETLTSPAEGLLGLPLRVRLFWQAKATIESNYTIFIHLVRPDEQLVAQQDQQPLGGFLPTRLWRPGLVIADDYELSLPPDAPPGPYELRVGMYDFTTGERLPVSQDGQVIGDYVNVATIP